MAINKQALTRRFQTFGACWHEGNDKKVLTNLGHHAYRIEYVGIRYFYSLKEIETWLCKEEAKLVQSQCRKQPRKTLMQQIMGESILLGGEVMTRREAIASLKADGCSERCIDFFVFGSHVVVVDPISEED